MALLRSGLVREEVELLKIETSEFSLIIKGKPYHERYLGLKQYNSLDFHDYMYLDVKGDGIEDIKVFDISLQKPVDPSVQRPIFFENGIYQVMLSPKTEKEYYFYHEHPLLRKAIDRVDIGNSYVLLGNLIFQNEIGFSTFEIMGEEQSLLQITIEIFPTKLNYKKDYRQLLNEVNEEIYNLAYHFLKKTYQSTNIRLEGNPSPAEFYRLISVYFDAFMKSINQIERQPHHKLENRYEMMRGDRIKNIDNRSRNFFRKNSQLFEVVNNGIEINDSLLMPTKGLSRKKEINFDTHENRYIKWIIRRLLNKVEHLYTRYIQRNKWADRDQDSDIIALLAKWKKSLEGKLNSYFWASIQIPDRTITSLVLQLAPGYRDAYQMYLIMSKGLTLQSGIYQMSVKDVATLYEYWTFLKLGQILNNKYELINQDIIKVNREGLYLNLEANRQSTRTFKHPVTKEKIKLTYQKYEGESPTIAQKPDTMLTIEKKGANYSYQYVFDAKYRIDFALEGSYYGNEYSSPGPLEEDINTMHRYRDSIVAEQNGPYERTAFGAYVLFPWNEEEIYQHHKLYRSIEKVNIGGFPFLPSATSLLERFIENLIDKSPDELQKEGILPRGSLTKWKESIEEKALVGVVSSMDDYRAHLKNKSYKLKFDNLRNGWQEVRYIALYLTKDVGTKNGVICYGEISNIQIKDQQVEFLVDEWINLPNIIKPVNYGIAIYALTTIQNLLVAKDLPELFMKSENEKIIWKMLRRISDKIRIELDKPLLDDAQQIINYQIKGLQLQFDLGHKLIVTDSQGSSTEIELHEVKNKTTQVFKFLVNKLTVRSEN